MAISSPEFHTNSTRIPRTELRTNSLRLVTRGGHGSIENTALRYHGPLSGQSRQGCDVDPRVVSVIAQRLPRVKPRAVAPRPCGAWPVCRCRAAPPCETEAAAAGCARDNSNSNIVSSEQVNPMDEAVAPPPVDPRRRKKTM